MKFSWGAAAAAVVLVGCSVNLKAPDVGDVSLGGKRDEQDPPSDPAPEQRAMMAAEVPAEGHPDAAPDSPDASADGSIPPTCQIATNDIPARSSQCTGGQEACPAECGGGSVYECADQRARPDIFGRNECYVITGPKWGTPHMCCPHRCVRHSLIDGRCGAGLGWYCPRDAAPPGRCNAVDSRDPRVVCCE
jgi:hypothetical protein